MDKLRGLKDRHPPIGDVRGIGLMIGVEIVRDRDTHGPAGAERERIVRGAFEKAFHEMRAGRYLEAHAAFEKSAPELLNEDFPKVESKNYRTAIDLALISSKTGEQQRADRLP